jgi:O-antigen ligase
MCLVLGGSVQGVWSNALLQLAGVAILVWAATSNADGQPARPLRQLFWIALAALVFVLLQLVPLPASLWPQLGAGRATLAEGFAVLGLQTPAASISVAPYSTVETLVTMIPPVAMFAAIVRLRAYRASWLALALLAGTFAGILLGALQVAGGNSWYLYRRTNFGFATGFFANANHMATLLVISLAFLGALLAAARGGSVQRYSAAVALVAGASLVVLVGLVLNGSLAGFGLALPVAAATLLLVLPVARRTRRLLVAGAVALLAAAAIALTMTPTGTQDRGAATSVSSRAEMFETTSTAIRDFLPFGSGLGTFRTVYQLYEDHDAITNTRVPHAHNDYAELVLELGIAGILLIGAFLLWWVSAAARTWRVADATPFARAASIASAAILAHSAVDYPLRTAAISAAFAMCLALLADRKVRKGSEDSELWPTRHVVLR